MLFEWLVQVTASMATALEAVSQASSALSSSIRQAATWLGHSHTPSASPAQLHKVKPAVSRTDHTQLPRSNDSTAILTPDGDWYCAPAMAVSLLHHPQRPETD